MKFELLEKDLIFLNKLFKTHESNIKFLDLILSGNLNLNNKIIFESKLIKEYESVIAHILNESINEPNLKSYINNSITALEGYEFNNNEYLKFLLSIDNSNITLIPSFDGFLYFDIYGQGGDYKIFSKIAFLNCDFIYPSFDNLFSFKPYDIKNNFLPCACAKGNVLLLGVSNGYFLFESIKKNSVKHIDVIESDMNKIKFFKHNFKNLDGFYKIKFINKKPYSYLLNVKDKDYDFIFCNNFYHFINDLDDFIITKKKLNNFNFTQRHYFAYDSFLAYFRILFIDYLYRKFYNLQINMNDLNNFFERKFKNVCFKSYDEIGDILTNNGINILINEK